MQEVAKSCQRGPLPCASAAMSVSSAQKEKECKRERERAEAHTQYPVLYHAETAAPTPHGHPWWLNTKYTSIYPALARLYFFSTTWNGVRAAAVSETSSASARFLKWDGWMGWGPQKFTLLYAQLWLYRLQCRQSVPPVIYDRFSSVVFFHVSPPRQ